MRKNLGLLLSSSKWLAVLALAMLTQGHAHAETSTRLAATVKTKVAQHFGVSRTGISVKLSPALLRASSPRFALVPHVRPSKTITQFVADVPDAPARAGFSVTGTIIKSSGNIRSMHRDSAD
jgi:hypothetical protein